MFKELTLDEEASAGYRSHLKSSHWNTLRIILLKNENLVIFPPSCNFNMTFFPPRNTRWSLMYVYLKSPCDIHMLILALKFFQTYIVKHLLYYSRLSQMIHNNSINVTLLDLSWLICIILSRWLPFGLSCLPWWWLLFSSWDSLMAGVRLSSTNLNHGSWLLCLCSQHLFTLCV